MGNTLEAVFRLTDQYTATMEKINRSTESAEKRQKQAQKATKEYKQELSSIKGASTAAVSGLDKVATKIVGLASIAYATKKAIGVMFDAIKTGAEKQVQLNTFQSLLNSDEAGSALFDYTRAYGNQKSVLGSMGIANATKSFLPFTNDLKELNRLYELTERLYARDPTQGSDGAVFAMKELISGDVMSARERFNISGLSGEKIRGLVNSGDMKGTLDYLDAMFNRFGATQGIVEKNFDSLQTQVTKFGDKVKDSLGDEAGPVVSNLSELFIKLNADMDAGKFEPFFTIVGNGMATLGYVASWVAQNISIIVPAVGGVVFALAAYKTATTVATFVTSAMDIVLSAATGNWIKLGAAVLGTVAAYGIYKNMDKMIESPEFGGTKDIESAMKKAEEAIEKASTGKLQVGAEVTNTAPISVKGQVEIERESQRYLFDLAAQKAIAMFNMQQITPSVTVNVDRVEQTTDLQEVANYLGDMVAESSGRQAAGVYG